MNSSKGNVDLNISAKNKLDDSASSATKPSLTSILHISNLTRPFTVSQLKELLGKYGSLLCMPPSSSGGSVSGAGEKHYFWINSVKSHCYVAFEDEEGAKAAREALNNTTWPQSNPKHLKVGLYRVYLIC